MDKIQGKKLISWTKYKDVLQEYGQKERVITLGAGKFLNLIDNRNKKTYNY